jgi:hypothetical protein
MAATRIAVLVTEVSHDLAAEATTPPNHQSRCTYRT